MVIRKNKRQLKKLRPFLLDKFGHKCVNCGAVDDLQIDHIQPLSSGGTDDVDNLQILCGDCNRRKAGAKNPMHQIVNEMLDQRRVAMRDQWAAENEEMYRNTPKLQPCSQSHLG